MARPPPRDIGLTSAVAVLRRLAFLGLVVAALGVGSTAGAGTALGHSLLQASSPAAGATLGSAPSSVKLTFGEPPDPRLSTVQVLDSSGGRIATGQLALAPGDPDSLEVTVGGLRDGVYTVTWRTVSAVDGHVAAGSFAFGVGVAPPAAGPAPVGGISTSGSPAAILARFLLDTGLIGLLGAAYVGFFVGGGLASGAVSLEGLATIAWLVAAIGTAFTVTVSWDEAGIDGSTLLVTSLGIVGIVRLVAIGLAGVPVFLLRRAGPGRRRLLGLAGLGAILAMTVDVAGGHAASAASGPIGLAAQWVHVVAAGLWIGGLLALLLTVRGEPSAARAAAVRRFSTWAAPWIGLVAITGVVRAVQEVGSIPALFEDAYGQLVILKSALLLVLAGLGATNRWWSVPAAARTLGRVRRVGTAELGVATIVFVAAAALVNGVPPVSIGAAQAAGPQPIVATSADAGTSVKVRLAITPGGPGANTFDAAVTDYDSGAPVPAAALALRFSLASRTGVGDSTLDLAPAAGSPGAFRATGSNLSVDGIWKVTATVGQGASAVEVPFVVATTIAAQPVDVLPGQGVPTIDTVHLPDATTAQLYLDPGTAGANELHITFFDATGTERPIATATMALPAGAGRLLAARLLEPGHFVADVQLDAGLLPVDVVGLDSTGAQVHVHATLEVTP